MAWLEPAHHDVERSATHLLAIIPAGTHNGHSRPLTKSYSVVSFALLASSRDSPGGPDEKTRLC
jgi:hypothetical protein